MKEANEDIIWMSGASDFAPEGKAHKGWVRVRERLMARLSRLAPDQHVHNSYTCSPHVAGCDCTAPERMTCNPYWVPGSCPDDAALQQASGQREGEERHFEELSADPDDYPLL